MNTTPTPLASTAMAAALYSDLCDNVFRKFGCLPIAADKESVAIIQKHFQPLLAKVEEPKQVAEYGEARPMARRANWDKRRRMRLQIGALGDAKSVTVTWEGNSTEVDAIAYKFMKAVKGEHALRADLAAKEAAIKTALARLRHVDPVWAQSAARGVLESALASRADKGGAT